MDSALAARSTASSFHLTAGPRDWAGAAGLLPAVPLSSSRAANQGRTTFQKPAPRNSLTAAIGSSRFEPNWRTFLYANSDRFPVCAGPTCVGIKPLALASAPAVLDRLAGPLPGQPCTSSHRNGVGFLLLDVPAGLPKGISSVHHDTDSDQLTEATSADHALFNSFIEREIRRRIENPKNPPSNSQDENP